MTLRISSFICLIFIIVSDISVFGQSADQFVEKSFLIIGSTKNIADAYSLAKRASAKTGIRFQDNHLQADNKIGVTYPADTCKANGFEFPCYVARGRFDDGVYLSVEFSDGYSGFAKGLFIVIAANGEVGDKEITQTLKRVKAYYPDSYIRQTRVFLGCIH